MISVIVVSDISFSSSGRGLSSGFLKRTALKRLTEKRLYQLSGVSYTLCLNAADQQLFWNYISVD